jgi:pyruvate formate-lyase activating enzyme-like uncharacterized protein
MEIKAGQYEKANLAEFAEGYQLMSFLSPAEAEMAEIERAALLAMMAGRVTVACQGSKIYTGVLAPGCSLCADGKWSCLFINNICNGRCFYCPTSQQAKSSPATNNLDFPNPQDYLDYLAVFGITGASISGGEPLLTFDRSLEYVRKIKKRFGSDIHLWLYSNGMLATPEKIKALREAGLDEMRFDISADCYKLDHLRLAVGHIPTITVEIPAIPEHYELLRDLLPELAAAGVNHLNLHQMRATPYNLPKLLTRGYRFVHAPMVLVHGSELTALRLIRDSLEMENVPAINYCSYAYKSRFQGRAARQRAARQLVRPHEDITDAGYLRSLRLVGPVAEINRLLATLEGTGGQKWWQRDGDGRLLLNASALVESDWRQLTLSVSYVTPQLRGSISYRGSHKDIVLNRKRKIFAERYQGLGPVEISGVEQGEFLLMLAQDRFARPETLSPALVEIAGYEKLPDNLFPGHSNE